VIEVLPNSFPVRRDSIEELVGHRNRALECAKQAYLLIAETNAAAQRAAPHVPGSGPLGGLRDGRISFYGLEEFNKDVRKAVDRDAWMSMVKLSGLRNLMDATAHETFRNSLEKDPPEFTLENVMGMFVQAANDAPQMLERSIVKVFDRLNTKRYKTNSAFRLGPRIILSGALATWRYGSGWNSYGYSFNLVADMDRFFHILDGKKPPEAGNAADAIGQAHTKGEKKFETEYFEARMFRGNGNLHLKFRRPDLVDKVNRVLAKHYGEALPDDRKVA